MREWVKWSAIAGMFLLYSTPWFLLLEVQYGGLVLDKEGLCIRTLVFPYNRVFSELVCQLTCIIPFAFNNVSECKESIISLAVLQHSEDIIKSGLQSIGVNQVVSGKESVIPHSLITDKEGVPSVVKVNQWNSLPLGQRPKITYEINVGKEEYLVAIDSNVKAYPTGTEKIVLKLPDTHNVRPGQQLIFFYYHSNYIHNQPLQYDTASSYINKETLWGTDIKPKELNHKNNALTSSIKCSDVTQEKLDAFMHDKCVAQYKSLGYQTTTLFNNNNNNNNNNIGRVTPVTITVKNSCFEGEIDDLISYQKTIKQMSIQTTISSVIGTAGENNDMDTRLTIPCRVEIMEGEIQMDMQTNQRLWLIWSQNLNKWLVLK